MALVSPSCRIIFKYSYLLLSLHAMRAATTAALRRTPTVPGIASRRVRSAAFASAASALPGRSLQATAASPLPAAPFVARRGGRPVTTFGLAARGGHFAAGSSGTALGSTATEATTEAAPTEVFRLDYKPLPHTVTAVNLDFCIRDGQTVVSSELTVVPNVGEGDLVLDGEASALTLRSIAIDGRSLVEGKDYSVDGDKLIVRSGSLYAVGKTECVLAIEVSIVPETNTQLSGLYKSGSMYCTQCEALGFRRITYFPDRPDAMAAFKRVRIEADRGAYPVLLSNGNRLEEGELEGGLRHYAVWSDPYPKPSYLFALVAGDLANISDSYTTVPSGRKVELNVYSEKHNVNKLRYAMESLIRSMKWDEDRFGLEYDLDLFNIVAVEDFNMGAMENKGLNVFNTAYVLADQSTATDGDYGRVEGVVGHEYFHNWTGNRVTCRDWFQLTLKEGLTVYRDQEFSADMGSRSVQRIQDVRGLRGAQFNQDAGPMAHPIRPESYISMDNFYTATVYSKGAEIIGMYATILGTDGFRKGMDLYFQRHDGSGVTCDDFRAAMSDANDADLDLFGEWYRTPGTPVVTYSSKYDADSQTFQLTLSQSIPVNPAIPDAPRGPLHIPIAVGLLDSETGKEVAATRVLHLKEQTQTFEFTDVPKEPVPSILRGFSAPVKLQPEGGVEDEAVLAFLAAHDTDGFNRWEAGQKIFTSLIFQTLNGEDASSTLERAEEAFGRTLASAADSDDRAIAAYAMTLPAESALLESMEVMDPVGVRKARGEAKKLLAQKFRVEIRALYDQLTAEADAAGDFVVDAPAVGRRMLRNICLDYMAAVKSTEEEVLAAAAVATAHYDSASCMTDKMAAFTVLSNMDGAGAAARDKAVQKFYDEANGDPLVLNKWFTVQAMAALPDIMERVRKLRDHPDFTLKNPNRCRALVSGFTANAGAYHADGGEGYKFVGKILAELDPINPQVSSRVAGSLIQWRRFDEKRGEMMKAELEKLKTMEGISDDLFEIVTKGLK
mmetsp:Transcript_1805/g.3694  ORF Transcript_1805/g.3694 Transcript_1805/m.3694 type:complete len:1008 (-) Transcript_1805:39-3062(-)